MSRAQIALFTFTLANAESIGPAALRELWVHASGTANVSVGRRELAGGRHDRPVYTLYAPQGLGDLREVEKRLRQSLETARLHAVLTSLHA